MNRFIAFIQTNPKAMFGAVVIVLLAVVVLIYEKPEGDADFLPITNIEVKGDFKYLSQLAVTRAVKSSMKGGFFTVDIEVIRLALVELPWVAEVSVRRKWPTGLTITVVEKQAVAYWGDDGLLSNEGEIFIPKTKQTELDLPRLYGPDELYETVWVFFKGANEKLNKLDIGIEKVLLDKRRSWEMQLSNDIVVRLGRDDTQNRLNRFIHVFSMNNAPDFKTIKSIDLRYPNGFATQKNKRTSDFKKRALVKEV